MIVTCDGHAHDVVHRTRYPPASEIATAVESEFPLDQNLTGLSWFGCKAEGNQYPIDKAMPQAYVAWSLRGQCSTRPAPSITPTPPPLFTGLPQTSTLLATLTPTLRATLTVRRCR